MKKLLVLATLTAAFASPALAQQVHHQRPANGPQWNEWAPTQAYGFAGTPNYRPQVTNPRGDIIVNGENQGTDPDPLVRLNLQRDPPHGG